MQSDGHVAGIALEREVVAENGDIVIALVVLLGIYTKQYIEAEPLFMIISII